MVEMIDKWEVVSKLITLQNNYNFFKNEWDTERLYREIAKLEIEIGKEKGIEIISCENCTHHDTEDCPQNRVWCKYLRRYMKLDGYCSYGERSNGATY